MNAPPERNSNRRDRTFEQAPQHQPNCRGELRKSGTAVRVRITSVLLNYRRVVVGGQRLRCHFAILALLNRDSRRGIQDALDEDVEGFGQGLAFALGDGRLFSQQT